jgi:hypothetical protein
MAETYVNPNLGADDDEFLATANRIDEEAEASSFGSSGNGTLEEYQSIGYCSLVQKKPVIVRAVGHAPIAISTFKEGGDLTTAIEVTSVEALGKENKPVRLILPERNDKESIATLHPVWRLVDTVLAYDIVDGKRSYRYQQVYPDLFAAIFNGGFKGDRGKYSKGLRGQRITIQNVIDRQDHDWHVFNKKTKILAKSSFPVKNGEAIGYQLGVPSYGYLQAWGDMWRSYGNWEKYDVAITRTGQTSPPITIKNASKFKEAGIPEIPPELLNLTVIGPLTEEERAYEKVEIVRLFNVSSYNKIISRLGGILLEADKSFGTKFHQEIKDLAADERKKNAAAAEDAPEEIEASKADRTSVVVNASDLASATVSSAAPATTRRAAAPAEASAINTNLLKGWDKLKPEEKASIVKTIEVGGVLQSIEYKPDTDPEHALLDCNICGKFSPSHFNHCPACGSVFTIT